MNIGNRGTGTLTIADGGVVTAPSVIAVNAGSNGTLNIGAASGSPAAAPGTLNAPSVAFGGVGAGTGTINFNHTSANYVFAPAISGGGTVNVLAGTTILTGANTYFGATNVDGGTLRAGAMNTFSSSAATTVASGGTLDLNGFNQTISNLTNAGLVNMGTGTAPGTALFVTNYTGTGGTIAMNTVLGGDGSPSDTLRHQPRRDRQHPVAHHQCGRPRRGDGGGWHPGGSGESRGTTAPGAFTLAAGEVRAGFFDYRLFRGGLDPSNSPNDWFLRSAFALVPIDPSTPLVPLVPIGPSLPGNPSVPLVPIGPSTPLPISPSCHPPRRRTRCCPASSFRSSGPNSPPMGWCSLWRGNWGLGSSARSTTGGATPTSRMVAPLRLRPLPPRPRLLRSICRPGSRRLADQEGAGAGPCPLFSPSVVGPLLRANDPQPLSSLRRSQRQRRSGRLPGRHRSSARIPDPGHYERAGLYGAYGDVHADVNGLVTNPAATAYVLNRTGSMNLNSWSAGGYWTHVGPGGWYLDAVLQGTWYYGSASTQFAKLNTDGTGFIGSLEGGYPFSWPQLGPGFVIEPQGQILWQKVQLPARL